MRRNTKIALSAAMAFGATCIALANQALAEEKIVRWRTIVGVTPTALNEETTPPTLVQNTVENIAPGADPWSARGGRARVDLATGQVDFEVEGLVLGGGKWIGSTGMVNVVKGTVVCVDRTTTAVIDTALVPLSAQGNAKFSGSLGPMPSTCKASNVAFLIRRDPPSRWLAYGAVRTSGREK
jgi:hypothetical protein